MNDYLTDKSNSFDDLLINYTPGDTLFPIVYVRSEQYQDEFFTSFYLNSQLAALNGVRFENDRLFINDTPEDNHTNRQLLLDNVGIDCRTYYVQNDKKSRCFFFSTLAVEAFLQNLYMGKVPEKQRNNLVGVVSLHHEGYKEALTVMLVRSPFICVGLDYRDLAWSQKYTSLKYVGKRALRMFIINHLCNLYLSKDINAPLYSPDINASDEQRALTELENQYYTLPEEIKNLYTLLPTDHSLIKNTEYSKSFRINLVSKYVRNLFNFLNNQNGVGLASQFLKENVFLSIDEYIEKAYNRIMGTPEFSFNNSITNTELMDLCVDLYFLNRLFAHILNARRVISRWLYILLYRARNEVLCSQRDFIDAMLVNTIAFNASQFDSMLSTIKDTRIKTRFFTMSWASDEDRFATSEIAFYFNGGEQPIINRLSDSERELLNDRGEFKYDTTFQQMIAYMHGCINHTMGSIEQLRETYAKLLYELLLQQSSIQPYFGFVEYEQMW